MQYKPTDAGLMRVRNKARMKKTRMMDDTQIIVSPESMKVVTMMRALEKSGHHNVPGKNQEV